MSCIFILLFSKRADENREITESNKVKMWMIMTIYTLK